MTTVDEDEWSTLAGHLTETEWGRANRYIRLADRKQFVLGRGLLRHLGEQLTGQASADLRISTAENGKPFFPDYPDIGFNLSHSGGWLLFAFLFDGGEVGVDVERIQQERDLSSVVQQYFSEEEQTEIQSGDSLPLFYRYWTRKEALLKAYGLGLVDGLEEISLLDGAYRLSFGASDLFPLVGRRYQVLSFRVGNGVVGSLAWDGKVDVVGFLDL